MRPQQIQSIVYGPRSHPLQTQLSGRACTLYDTVLTALVRPPARVASTLYGPLFFSFLALIAALIAARCSSTLRSACSLIAARCACTASCFSEKTGAWCPALLSAPFSA